MKTKTYLTCDTETKEHMMKLVSYILQRGKMFVSTFPYGIAFSMKTNENEYLDLKNCSSLGTFSNQCSTESLEIC